MTLRFDHVTVNVNGRDILRDISGELCQGKVTVILGANGAGKSTLLSCLAGLRRPYAGQVLLSGTPIETLPAQQRARRIGVLPQQAEIHWDVDVQSLVALGRLPHHGRWGPNKGAAGEADYTAVARAMAATDVTHLARRKAQQLSGGEQTRVLLARVLAGEPEWLLADEPLANLDPAHQLDALARFTTCAQSGMGVILVLHDLTQAARIADHLLVMQAGKIIACGNPDVVLTPDTLADAFGIHAHIGRDDDGKRFILPVAKIA